MDRLRWHKLPAEVRSAVRRKLSGEEFTVEDMATGGNSAMAAMFTLGDHRRVFVKGMPSDHEQAGELELERRVNPHLPDCAPRLLWDVESDGWTLLAFEGIDGTWADFTAGSSGLELVASALVALDGCAPPPLRLPTAWDRWGYYCDPKDEVHLTGQQLLHTDPAGTNFVISDRAYLIDWAWPAVGPSWVDPTLWGMRLVVDGEQTPEEAYTWASQVPAFRQASPYALSVLAQAEARRWEGYLADGEPNMEEIAKAARAWAEFLA